LLIIHRPIARAKIHGSGENLPDAAARTDGLVPRYADMLSAMGTEPRLRIMRLLLAAHPDGMVPTEIGNELDIPPSSLSHHLEKLKNEELVDVRRDSKFLWYTANTESLKELLGFLYAECCTRNKAIKPECVLELCK
jgi:ArsR family transcriptional regulator